MIFRDRKEAGKKLALKLERYKNSKETVVLGLARGGVVVAREVAQILNLSLDVLTPRKIGFPENPEFAIGAVMEDGSGIFDEQTIAAYNIQKKYIDKETEKEKQESLRRLTLYRDGREPLDLKDKTAIIVDDGVATGITMRAAIKSVKLKRAKKIVVAVPVIAGDSLEAIQKEVDEVVYIDAPVFFMAVGNFYETFTQTEDSEVIELMKKSFKEKVLDVAARVPKGQTMSYKEVARLAGSPGACRAVGNVLNKNYNPNIPCHRIIRSDGKIGGYNRGIKKKIRLLKKEKMAGKVL